MYLPCGVRSDSYKADMAVVRTRTQWGLLIGFLTLLFLFPLFSGARALELVSATIIIIIAVQGLNIVSGYCGQISLAQVAFLAVGAYTSANLVTKVGLPFWVALPCAGIVAASMGLIVGLPSLRTKGLYLGLTTIAFHFIFFYLVWHVPCLTGGSFGLVARRPELISSQPRYYWFIIAVALLLILFAKNLARTGAGRAFIAIRDNEIAAEGMGVHLFRYKLLAFTISAFYGGIAGSLWAHFMTHIDPDHFQLMETIWYLGMLIVGGMGSTLGAILGVVFMKLLRELAFVIGPVIGNVVPSMKGITSAALANMIFAIVLILFLVYEPRGLAHRWETFKASYRVFPFAY